MKLGNKELLDKEQMNHFLWPICHLLHKNKEHLPLRNNFRVTKSSLFPCSTVSLILTIFWYLVLLFRNQLKQQVENVFFINIWFVEGEEKKSALTNCRFRTISSQISAIYMNIFHKTEVQTVILRCWMGLYLNWVKSYDTKCNFFHFRFSAIL